jgi:hypothetical protein
VLAGHTHVPSVCVLDQVAAADAGRTVEAVGGTATSTRLRGVPRSWSLVRVESSTITVEERRELGSRWTAARFTVRSSIDRQGGGYVQSPF